MFLGNITSVNQRKILTERLRILGNPIKVITYSVLNHELVEYVYRSDTQMFDHVLLSGPKANVYVTIVIDLNEVVIKGHYILDLNDLYGV